MSCNLEILDHYVYRELGAREARSVERHLAACAECRREAEWLRTERKWVSALSTGAGAGAPVAPLAPLLRRPPLAQLSAGFLALAATLVLVLSSVQVGARAEGGWSCCLAPTEDALCVARAAEPITLLEAEPDSCFDPTSAESSAVALCL